ncbi:two pore potassium channel protein sup-9 isoform X3 [Tenebrio molitor]
METVVLKSEPHRAGQQWKFTGAFYYATTVLTTIGYGHSTPSTIAGKLFTMCYAMIGIPLGLVMFQSIGERVNRLSRIKPYGVHWTRRLHQSFSCCSVIIRSVKSSLHCRQTAASELDLICVVTTLSSLTIAGGAAAFSRYEGWSYFDSVYYCFITLTTIGFGDMVALQKDNALSKKPEYVMFALIFILFGLAIVAASLNLLVLRFVTMNTEDERRDEAQAMQALAGAVRLEGDVITANGSILSGQMGHHCTETTSLDADDTSVCSCHCGCFTSNSRHRFGNVFGRVRTPVSIKVLVWPRPIAEVDTFLRDQSLLALKQSNFKRNPRAPPTDRTICALSHFVDLGVCRFTVRRSPTQIRHLLPVLPMHELHLPQGPVLPPPAIYPNHRASI